MKLSKDMTRQKMLDKTPESNNEVALQNLLHTFSKTKLEQIKRTFQEVNNLALYKTQLRELPFIAVLEAIQAGVELFKLEKNE